MADRSPVDGATQDDTTEPEKEEQRERYRELLEELRTVIPGVQVLFAFLLTVPFSSRFEEVDALGKRIFAAALLGTALAAVLLLGPAAYHRLSEGHQRAVRLHVSIRLTIAGMTLLALSVPAALFVVVRFVFDSTVAGLALAAIAAITAGTVWYALPLSRR